MATARTTTEVKMMMNATKQHMLMEVTAVLRNYSGGGADIMGCGLVAGVTI